MFDIGFWELVLISVIALVVLGPERLPQAIRSLARFIASVKKIANHVQHELSQELQIQELKDNHQQAEQMKANDPFPELHQSHESVDTPIRDVEQPSTHDESAEKSSK
ncbi:Sec-independent protein translocase protein TatB [Vibrio gazogenes]|uniref:Sec-independent protein translocase protein TatB n=1 Tax=Vibrio gazogenes DSM 21264 = NBRC 103151 TaxID=1123492 RepID=A0A1M5BRH9_VIBGA|nr:Sec-independent protein translocase protein TatB [Vibrio gazogenes]USP13685.1 Sec-independent protein translocase protein TatB [Vibrio gazogenes]SHF45143.1 Sec-independent protein translocase TatB [Vibrio gazogenes DSM 21264] [Vibrio gazogenes DSM 21264 = NBRC 103151]SJN54434.1 Sec-independent protein translocase protein TatB [Vibrio gazogenes]